MNRRKCRVAPVFHQVDFGRLLLYMLVKIFFALFLFILIEPAVLELLVGSSMAERPIVGKPSGASCVNCFKDYYQETDVAAKNATNSVALILTVNATFPLGVVKRKTWYGFSITDPKYKSLPTQSAGQNWDLLDNDTFRLQPTINYVDKSDPVCTGVLVADDLLATASHCIRKSLNSLNELRVVFGYRKKDFGSFTENIVSIWDIYSVKGIARISSEDDSPSNTPDWALIQLDRKVSLKGTARVANISNITMSIDSKVFSVHHPLGLPQKISSKNQVSIAGIPYEGYFQAVLNTLPGSSGAPVFQTNNNVNTVVGIVKGGRPLKTITLSNDVDNSIDGSLCDPASTECFPTLITETTYFYKDVEKHKAYLLNPNSLEATKYFKCVKDDPIGISKNCNAAPL